MSYDTPPQFPTIYVPAEAEFMFIAEGEHTADEAGRVLMAYFWAVKITDLYQIEDHTFFKAEFEIEVECFDYEAEFYAEEELAQFKPGHKVLELQNHQIYANHE